MSVRVYSGYLHFWCEPTVCDPRAHGVRGIGLDAFHGHVADGHFVVVPV